MNTIVAYTVIIIVLSILVMCVITNNYHESYACTQQQCNAWSEGNEATLQCMTSSFGDQSCCYPDSGLVPTCDQSGQKCGCCPPDYWIDDTQYDAAYKTCIGDNALYPSFYGGDFECGSYCNPPTYLTLQEVFNLQPDTSNPNGYGTTKNHFPPGNYSQVGGGQYYLHCEFGRGVINAANSTVTFPTSPPAPLSQTLTITSFLPTNQVIFLSKLTRPNVTTYKKLDFFSIQPN